MRNAQKSAVKAGTTLVETIVSVGVLALAVPLVMGSLMESGKSGTSAMAETRASWIVPACLNELSAAADGKGQWLPRTALGTAFPPAGEVYAIAFSESGEALGAVDKAGYEAGVKRLNDKDVRYIGLMEGEVLTPTRAGASTLRSVRVCLEYPAAVPASKRTKLDFYTRTP